MNVCMAINYHCYVQKVDLKYVVTRISDGKTREYDSLLEALTFCRTSFFLYYIKYPEIKTKKVVSE